MPWIAAGASIASGLLSSSGQRKANQQNLQIAREQMKFQERMSSTAVQRQVKDMRRAGINPILAAPGGASTPGGSQATMENPQAGAAEGISKASQTALAMKIGKAQLANLGADTNLKNENALTAQEQQSNLRAQWRYINGQLRQVNANSALAEAALPVAQAEEEFWKNLNDGEYGDWAKALQFIKSLVK